MEISIFLAKIIGWYFIIMSLFTLIKPQFVKTLMSDILTRNSLLFFTAIVTLILGIILVVSHNIWIWGWPVIITLISWLVLISGITRLFFPDTVKKTWQCWIHHPNYLMIATVISLLIGIYLIYIAYFWG